MFYLVSRRETHYYRDDSAVHLVRGRAHSVGQVLPSGPFQKIFINSVEQFSGNFNTYIYIVCKIPLLARAFGARTRPSARATIGYLVYKHLQYFFGIMIFEILVGRNTLSIGKTFAEIFGPLRQIGYVPRPCPNIAQKYGILIQK